jgi:ATP-dependent RNA helicase RhlE
MNFDSFNFDPRIAAGIRSSGYTEPTPIQLQAIPPVLAGRDVMGLAQTGTGKTAAFVLPILQRLLNGPRGRVRALIIAPTRELAEQIHQTIVQLGAETRLRSVSVYGGVSMNMQSDKLRRGAEIVVACPGRLLDHLQQGSFNLSQVEVLVIDEADRMFDMGFLPEVRKIIKQVPAKRQTLFFSATMPEDVRRLAKDVLGDPTRVQIGDSSPVDTVSHALYPVSPPLKTALLLELLRHTDTESVLVFTRTKHRAKRLGDQLKKAGYKATSLQGNLSQNQRQASLDGFRSGKFQIMVATDIAARGIDVTSISHVINYDIPDTAEAYTHRIGRTGRAAKTGDAFTLITGEDTDMVKTIERILGTKLERRKIDGFNYDAKPERETEPQRPMNTQRPSRSSRPPSQPSRGPRTGNVNGPSNGNSRNGSGSSNGNSRNSNNSNSRRPENSKPQPVANSNGPASSPKSNDPYPYVSRLASDLPSQQAGYNNRQRPKNTVNKKRRYTPR